MREVRSNSLIIDDTPFKKVRQRQGSVGIFSVQSPLTKKFTQNKPDPSSFVLLVPAINVPTDKYIELHKKFCLLQINQNLAKLNQLSSISSEKAVQSSMKTSCLIQEMNTLLNQRKKFEGRGLNENRKMFFLIDYLNKLKLKEATIETRYYEEQLEYIVEMQKFLQNPPDYKNFHLVINLQGYLEAIPNRDEKLPKIREKVKILEKYITKPTYLPPPTNFEDQLIYPTSSTFPTFKNFEKKAKMLTFAEVFRETKLLTDDNEELDILLNHAFSYGWRKVEFPFLDKNKVDLNVSYDMKVKMFDPPYLPDEFMDLTLNELRFSDWPYSSVVDILDEIFFLINPIEAAKTFYKAMEETAKCVSEIKNDNQLVDFDTIFPLILLSVLASGLLSQPEVLYYIASLSIIKYYDSHVNFAASYVEAIIQHLSTFNESDTIIFPDLSQSSQNCEAE